ncbi:MAG: N-6 DNA methylase [Solirubrobacteraceae bacterium]
MATDPKTSGNGDQPAETVLFEAADRLRGSVESSEYKHLVLGLIFLKYISDSFETRRLQLEREFGDPDSEDYIADAEIRADAIEDRSEYEAKNVFWVPQNARWDALLKAASLDDIGTRIDRAMTEIETENPELNGVLPHIYARAPLGPGKLGELVETVAKIGFGDDPDAARDVLGRVYEYFIKEFARSEGHRGGEFYTPAVVTRLLVEMLEPYHGRVFDPACGSCGLFIQSARFVEAHGGRTEEIAIYGQEKNQATRRIGLMNLAIHGLSGDIKLGDTLLDDQHSGLKADFVIANPPFMLDRWGAAQVAGDKRWVHGDPPDANANYAWVQHFLHHLAPDGRAGFVLANGSLSTSTTSESRIREQLVRDDAVDCIVALPSKLFYTTGIAVCLWFLDRNKASATERDRRGEVLFIDARDMGHKISRTQIELSEDELLKIANVYHAWRGRPDAAKYEDEPRFCKSATLAEIEAQNFFLVPRRVCGARAGGRRGGVLARKARAACSRSRPTHPQLPLACSR